MTPETMAHLHGQAFDRGWSARELKDLLARDGATTITHDKGFVLANQVLDEAELLTIVIAPDARGQGIGHHLLDMLVTKLRNQGTQRLFLEVAEDNAPALGLYRAAGFAEVGRRKGYYPRDGKAPADARVLSLDLSAAREGPRG
ncbi:GNAT family N-acetyltransferase [Roseobacteraceae bacterium S113]